MDSVICACPSCDAKRCYQVRYPRDSDDFESDDACECCCHEPDEDSYKPLT